MTIEELVPLIEQWGEDRGILAKSNRQAQLLKTMSELGELADATLKGDVGGVLDGVGDVLVTLILYSRLSGLSLAGCLEHAWDQIKDRKGKMSVGGVFVKEGG